MRNASMAKRTLANVCISCTIFAVLICASLAVRVLPASLRQHGEASISARHPVAFSYDGILRQDSFEDTALADEDTGETGVLDDETLDDVSTTDGNGEDPALSGDEFAEGQNGAASTEGTGTTGSGESDVPTAGDPELDADGEGTGTGTTAGSEEGSSTAAANDTGVAGGADSNPTVNAEGVANEEDATSEGEDRGSAVPEAQDGSETTSAQSEGTEAAPGDGGGASNETENEESANMTASSGLSDSTVNNETSSISSFKLNVVGENDAEELLSIPVFEGGQLVGALASCSNSSQIVDGASAEDACHTDGPYVDRLSFKFAYLPDAKDFQISKPTVATSSFSGIRPEVMDFRNSPEDGSGSFSIVFHCAPGRDESTKSLLSFHFRITEEHSINTIWAKECGHGRNELVEFGFTSHTQETVLFNPDGTYGSDDKDRLEVGPLDLSTELVMRLKPPALTQEFLAPTVSSSSPEVEVSLRQTVFGGTVVGDVDTKFSVLYECKTTTAADIKFSVAIPPWDNVTAVWRKDCGGSHAAALLIGLSGPDTVEVMQDKELDPKFNATELTTTDDAYARKLYELDGDKDQIRFYLTNSDDTSEIHIQDVSTTMSSPDIVSANVEVPRLSLSSSGYIPPRGTMLGRGETKILFLHFICKKAGTVVVLVTLPTLRYKNVEFGFIKQCSSPHVLHRSGFLQTANSLLLAFFVVVVGAAVGGFVYLRRLRSGNKYAPVAVREGA